jgi:hypothetical protein
MDGLAHDIPLSGRFIFSGGQPADKINRQLEAGGVVAAGAGGVQARQAQADGPRSIGGGVLRMAIIVLV